MNRLCNIFRIRARQAANRRPSTGEHINMMIALQTHNLIGRQPRIGKHARLLNQALPPSGSLQPLELIIQNLAHLLDATAHS